MLNCEYCDYFCNDKGNNTCKFTDFVFNKNVVEMEKYPCEKLSFKAYSEKIELKREALDMRQRAVEKVCASKAI